MIPHFSLSFSQKMRTRQANSLLHSTSPLRKIESSVVRHYPPPPSQRGGLSTAWRDGTGRKGRSVALSVACAETTFATFRRRSGQGLSHTHCPPIIEPPKLFLTSEPFTLLLPFCSYSPFSPPLSSPFSSCSFVSKRSAAFELRTVSYRVQTFLRHKQRHSLNKGTCRGTPSAKALP